MKKIKKHRLISVLMALVLILAMIPGTAMAQEIRLTEGVSETVTFIHTNDVHGHLDIEPYVKSVADAYKAVNGDANVITASAGDVFGGGEAIAHLTKGEAVRDVMNAAGYDVMTIGNNDLLAQCGQIINFNNRSEGGTNFPILGSNLRIGATIDPSIDASYGYKQGDQPLPSYEIFVTETGKEVGVFGVGTYMEDLAYYTTGATIESAKHCIAELKKAGVDIIVGLTHTGWEDDLISTSSNDVNSYQVAMAVDGIDLIIDGHSHSIIGGGDGYTCDNSDKTLIVSANCLGEGIGVVNLALDADGGILSKSASLLSKDDYQEKYAADSAVEKIVQDWMEKFESDYQEVVGTTSYFLNGARKNASPDKLGIRLAEQNLGNLITDALRYGIEEMGDVKDADVVFFNAAMIRASIEVGNITRLNVMNVFANGGTICIQEMTGAELKALLTESVEPASRGVEDAAYKQVSGLSFTYGDGGTIISATMSDGSTLDKDATYRVAYAPRIVPEGAKVVYDGYFELADALITYLNSDAYSTDDYAGSQGRIAASFTYGLYYGSNGGNDSSLPADITGDFSSDKDDNNQVKVTVSSDKPTRSNYTFVGWNDKADGTGSGYKAGDEIIFDGNNKTLTLHAQWTENQSITPGEKEGEQSIAAPGNVTGLKKTSSKTDSITMSWSKVSDASGYEVLLIKDGKTALTKTTTSTSYTFKNLKASNIYSIKVRAYKAVDGSKIYGNYTAYTTATNPAKVTGLKKASNKTTSITTSWSKVSNASGYQVVLVKGGKTVSSKTTTKTSYIFKNLTAGSAYSIKVRAYKTVNGSKVYGSYSTVLKTAASPAQVKSLAVKRTSSAQAKLTWKKASGASGYEVWRKTTGSWKKIKTLSATSLTSATKSKGMYQYKVRAYKAVNNKKIYGSFSSVRKYNKK